MQPVEEFMRQYFTERLADEQRELASRAPFRKKFHTPDCIWDSRAGTAETMQTEQILRAATSDTGAEVVTTRTSELTGPHQLRYHLRATTGTWLIQTVDLWCSQCRGETNNSSCFLCGGTGWLDFKRTREKLLAKKSQSFIIPPDRLGGTAAG